MIEVEKINAVLRMQDYITENLENEIDIDEVVKVSMYSKRHALRIFKELLALTINEYIRDCRLVRAAKKLVDENNSYNILNVALDAGFDSHEGFTKAFYKYFGVLPQNFKKRDFPQDFIKPTPISCYYLRLRGCGYPLSKGDENMSGRVVTATYVTKSARKLIIKRGILSSDYFSYCDEIGCDIGDELAALPNTLEKYVFIELPEYMLKDGTSAVGAAAEVPIDWQGKIPQGCDIIELSEQIMVWFQGQPYEEENWFGCAHDELNCAMANYNPEVYGYEYAFDSYPKFQYGATAKNGVKAMYPVKKK